MSKQKVMQECFEHSYGVAWQSQPYSEQSLMQGVWETAWFASRATLDSEKQQRLPSTDTHEMDEDRIDRIAASHGDGEHYGEVGE